MKKVIALLMMLGFSSCAFALEMYAGATLGYSFWAPEVSDVYFESNCFEASPMFGIFPLADNDIFGVEATVDLNFSGNDTYSTTVIAPKVLAKAFLPLNMIAKDSELASKFSLYTGFGFSVPIQTVSLKTKSAISETNANFNLDLQFGAFYKITEKILVNVDLNSTLLKPWNWSVKAGGCYKIN